MSDESTENAQNRNARRRKQITKKRFPKGNTNQGYSSSDDQFVRKPPPKQSKDVQKHTETSLSEGRTLEDEQRNSQDDVQAIEPMLSPFDYVPDKILVDIFNNLPPRCRMSMAGVCRRWYRIVWDPNLWLSLELRCPLKTNSTALILQKCKALRSLTLARASWEDLQEVAPTLAGFCPNLESIHLYDCLSLNVPALQLIAESCRKVSTFRLNVQQSAIWYNNDTNESKYAEYRDLLAIVLDWPELFHLEFLLTKNNVGLIPSTVASITELKAKLVRCWVIPNDDTNVARLNYVTEVDLIPSIMFLSRTITVLQLDFNWSNRKRLVHSLLVAIASCTHLKSLTLLEFRLSLRKFGILHHLQKLTDLSLVPVNQLLRNPMSQGKELFRKPLTQSLLKLDLKNYTVNDEIVLQIGVSCKKLQSLRITASNLLTDDGLSQFLRTAPKLLRFTLEDSWVFGQNFRFVSFLADDSCQVKFLWLNDVSAEQNLMIEQIVDEHSIPKGKVIVKVR